MRRFEFKLARLARVRAIEEELARASWQAAEGQVRRAEAQLLAARQNAAEAVEALRRAQSDARISPLEVLNIDSALTRLERRAVYARSELHERRAAAEELRKPWQALRTEIEGLARLEDKARTRHRLDREREETLQMDQIAAERAARRSARIARGPAPRSTPDLRRARAGS